MTENKYVAMMDEAAWECLDEAHINEQEGNLKVADMERKHAADWRAMREAWESMEAALELASYGVFSEPENVLAEVRSALAKARTT